MKILKTPLAAALLGALALTAQASDEVQLDGAKVGHWTMDFDAATKLAAEKELPLILNFTGSDWCGWCKIMDEGVFAKADWKKFAADNVVLVTLDFPKDKSIVPEKYVERNQKLKTQFEVRGFPSYVILDSDGETKLGQLGSGRDKTPSSFIAEFETVIKTSPAGIEEYVKANPDKADAFKAAVKESNDAKKALTDWIATKPKQNDENNKLFAEFKERINKAGEALSKF